MISNREKPSINSSSMADIAFLLLIFFLVSTRISTEKGFAMSLPPKTEQNTSPTPALDRDVLRISLNATNEILFESDKIGTISEIEDLVKTHLTNYNKDENYSQNPQKAVVVLNSQRQTDYNFYIQVLDKIKAGYHKARADFLTQKLGVKYTALEVIYFAQQKTQEEKEIYQLLQKEFPINILEQKNPM